MGSWETTGTLESLDGVITSLKTNINNGKVNVKIYIQYIDSS